MHVRPSSRFGLGRDVTHIRRENISFRCRRHNQFEAEQVFGRRDGIPNAIVAVDT
jgi:hypothetical protein